MVSDDDDNIDDKRVIFDSPTERIVHVHRVNIVANVKGEWTRPTLLIAAEGQTPVFCHGVLVQGPSKIVERPPGVHTVLHPTTKVVALDASGAALPLPPWAEPIPANPEKLSDVELVIQALDRAGLEPEAISMAKRLGLRRVEEMLMAELEAGLEIQPKTNRKWEAGNVVEWPSLEREVLYTSEQLAFADRTQPRYICARPHDDGQFDYLCEESPDCACRLPKEENATS